MNVEAPAEHTSASALLQTPPITPNLASDGIMPMPPKAAPQVPASTWMSISTTLSPSGKKRTITAKVFTNSGETPTGIVMFQAGRKLWKRGPLANGIASICVSATQVRGTITANYNGDHHHLTSTVKLMPITNASKAEPSAPKDSELLTPPPDGHEDLASGTATPGDDEKETALATEIAELWHSEQFKSILIRHSRKEISGNREQRAALRLSLGERLDEYKRLLVRAGRPGMWMAFLREVDIPKSTAERYLEKWKLSQMPKPENRTTGTIHGPSNENIAALVNTVKLKADRVLTTPESVAQFLSEITTALQPPTTAT